MHAVERELIKATGYKSQRKFDNRQDYLGSLLNAVFKLSDADFDLLPDDAATWANAATEAKNSKAEELPDFDEVSYDGEPADDSDDTDDSEDDPDAEPSDDQDEDSGDDEDSDEEIAEDEDEADEEPEPVKASKEKPKTKKAVKEKTLQQQMTPKAKSNKPKQFIDEDVVLDKWGCMEGSKNSQALGLFEKGATAKEVKDKLGGTYYNILGKCVQNGHKLEKEGSLIKLTHKDEVGVKKLPPAKKKK